MTRRSKTSRNKPLARGIEGLSRTESYHARGRWAKKPKEWKAVPAPSKPASKEKVKPFGKDGKRVVKPRAPRFYPVYAPKRQLPSRKSKHQAPRLRKSLVPGKILILLSGKYRGHRVVLLKTLPSGLLVITGPFKINGVPLKRVNPAYVIATSTRVDLSGFVLDQKFNDQYFARPKKTVAKKADKKPEEQFFSTETKKKEISPERKQDQKDVDKKVLELVEKTENLAEYLGARFTLSRHQYPHLLKF